MSVAAPASAAATYRRLLAYSARHWPIAVLAVLGMAVDAGATAGFTWLIKPMLDDLFVRQDQNTIFWMPILIVIVFVLRGIATWLTDYGVARVGRGVVHSLREQVFARYLVMPAGYFDREASGQLISRVTYTVEQVAQASTEAVKVMIVDSLTVLGMLFVMLWYGARLTLALFVMAPLIAALVWFVGRRYRRISHRIQHSVGSVTGVVEEVVGGQREVKVYGGGTYEQQRFAEINEHNRRLNLKVASTNALSTALVQIIAACALAGVVFFATRPAMLAQMSAGSFMATITAMIAMLPSLKRLTTVQAMMQRGVAAAQDLFAILDTPGEPDGGTAQIARSRGEIALERVSLRYPGASSDALHEVDLFCPAGKVTALVGRSGSGKTTLASLIPRFYEPGTGRVLLDGRPLTEWTLASLRDQIALVSQHVVLFNDSIARNIAYGALGGATRERIREAAAAANALEFIERLPDGLDSRVGEGGALLSGGQRQRIAIARAILKNAPILILDEATSALDTESERLIQDALARLMRERTTLVIAHRLSTIEHADQIVVLDQGRIVETGRHDELLARGGHYAALHRMQFHDTAGA
ncbi:MAG TPA: lipid A export permease/ATP-binding protein MsbA [Tahibacter sp.]|uniref:lipid A export permease/ATP-binding protein MsbA n=1 Tax=Tahibacter sp. TaxID=2056211 RepID=UPI002C5715D7|nr:lipid A export permease/ATP-binding protein MsbA [Tahibacter sp.]HSX62205.1 lipid A export permease/ATP-binding protein MsbA [Tahibacter sp.]